MSAQPPYGWGGPGYPGPPQPSYYPRPAGTEGQAIAVFVLSIASFVICPVVPAIVALALAPGARRRIAESGGRLDGHGLLTAGVVISWVHLAMVILAVIAVVLLVVVAGGSGGTGGGSGGPGVINGLASIAYSARGGAPL